jgi:hypothetical protein
LRWCTSGNCELLSSQLAALVVDESKWLAASMTVALLAVTVLLLRHSKLPARRRVLAAMNLFFGVTIGTMAFGHLLAVTTKLALRTLEGPVQVFYLIGIAVAVPSWWLTYHTRRVLAEGDAHGQATVRLNAWLAITLLGLGLHNLPLAVPGLFNIAYHLQTRRLVGWALVGMTIVFNVALFIGALLFLASGQSFEQFRGIE